MHVPKTAGTSLVAEIKRGKLGRYLLDYDDRPTSAALRHRLGRAMAHVRVRLEASRIRRDYDVLHGHFQAGKYAFLRPESWFITFLRDPVPRLISHYYYFRDVASKNPATVAKNPVIGLIAEGEVGLVEFARSEAMSRLYERFLDGVPLDEYALIGITERYAESVACLNRLLGSALEVQHERRSGQESHMVEYRHLLPELEEANRENARIYAEAVRLFERKLAT
ncbi:MAG TPA: hypothetical protein VF651_12680 [Gammaproteobacteria bacterium]